MSHDPLSPSEALRTRIGTVAVIAALLTIVYSVAILAEVLLGLVVAIGLTAVPYLAYRTFAVLDSIVDAAQRFAAVREHEVESDRGPEFGSATDRRESSADRLTERER